MREAKNGEITYLAIVGGRRAIGNVKKNTKKTKPGRE